MHAVKAVFSQGSHFLVRMAPPKSFQKVGLSFALQTRYAAAWCRSGHACRNASGSASASMLSRAMECPKLGKVGSTCPWFSSESSSAKMLSHAMDCPKLRKVGSACPSSAIANPKVVLQKSSTNQPIVGLFTRLQLEHVPSACASSRSNATNSRRIHRGVDKEDDWSLGADKEDFLSRKVSSKGTKKGLPGRQQSDFGTADRRSSASEDRIYFLGRLLTSLLRHRAVDLKLEVRDDGYVVVSDLLKLAIKTRAGIPLSVYTVEDVLKAVERDNKQRFTLLTENGVLLIRASQGHSIKTIDSDKLLKPILSSDEIPVCVHGTLMSNLSSILKTGLKKMGRNHVHFASGLPREGGVISGMRYTSDVLIYLDSKKALQDGMKLYMSDNGVILTEGFDGVVPPEYFAKIVKWKNGKLIPLPSHESV